MLYLVLDKNPNDKYEAQTFFTNEADFKGVSEYENGVIFAFKVQQDTDLIKALECFMQHDDVMADGYGCKVEKFIKALKKDTTHQLFNNVMKNIQWLHNTSMTTIYYDILVTYEATDLYDYSNELLMLDGNIENLAQDSQEFQLTTLHFCLKNDLLIDNQDFNLLELQQIDKIKEMYKLQELKDKLKERQKDLKRLKKETNITKKEIARLKEKIEQTENKNRG